LQFFSRWSAFIEETQVLGGRVSTIKKTSTKIDSKWRSRLTNNSWLSTGNERNESSLAYDVITANDVSLPELSAGIGEQQEKRRKSNVIFWLFPISFFILSLIWLYHGLPRRNPVGFLIVIGAAICWIIGTILTLEQAQGGLSVAKPTRFGDDD
jgi:hypothetical protein